VGLEFDGPYGVYHSMYDDYFWMNHFGDPGYRYHAMITQVWGELALRLANSQVLPYDFEAYARDIRVFVQELDRRSHVSAHLDLAPLLAHITEFETAGREWNEAAAQALRNGSFDSAAAGRVNRALMRVERNWCNPEGIPGRPWFKHTLYAARYTYAHLELPGLTEAAEAGDWKHAGEQEQILESELKKNSEVLRQARTDLQLTTSSEKP
jgi:N-acetylated-alpha-linked acidic dipeptidase